VLGTPSYMAPEQARGDKSISVSADVYGLGAILYETLAGRPPFAADSVVDTLLQVLGNDPVRPSVLRPQLDRDLETICLKCLEKTPAKRYGSARDLADDLQRWLNGEPIRARRTGVLERALKLARRRPLVTLLLAGLLGAVLVAFVGITWQYRVAAGERDVAVQANERRNRLQVEQLGTAVPEAVPAILEALKEDREALLPQLRQRWDDGTRDRHQRLRVGLALLPSDPEAIKTPLSDWLLEVENPRELLLVRDALAPYKEGLAARLWQRAEDEQQTPESRFRALAALAAFDRDHPRWRTLAPLAVRQLVQANSMSLDAWTQALLPVRDVLTDHLRAEFRGKGPPRRQAASILAVYAADQPEMLADLVADADVDQFNLFLPLLPQHRDKLVGLFRQELARLPPGEEKPDYEAQRDRLARRQANAGLALLHLDSPEEVWPLFRHRLDPSLRTYLALRAGPQRVPAPVLSERLRVEDDVSAKRALVLALGQYIEDQLPAAKRQEIVQRLLGWYRTDPDPGLHAAVDWLLGPGTDGRQPRPYAWGQGSALREADEALTRQASAALPATIASLVGTVGSPGGEGWLLACGSLVARRQARADRPRWQVNTQGQTLVVFPPDAFRMGSPQKETGRYGDLPRHTRRLGRSFALASRPVTVRQFQAFLDACPAVRHQFTHEFSPDPDGPIVNLTWYDAIQYCRWLSEREGIPEDEMCYPTIAEIQKCKETAGKPVPQLVRLPADYLARTGYRLPTEAEYEYACRAGASSSRYFGSSEELLEEHGWYSLNARHRAWPSGQKRPNDFGLFDMLGNVWSWCQEVPRPDLAENQEVSDREEGRPTPAPGCVMRGGSFDNPARDLRCGYRIVNPQTRRNVLSVSVRVARTCP
jgi:eukaryotic-like serine/threonine-protein kinase